MNTAKHSSYTQNLKHNDKTGMLGKVMAMGTGVGTGYLVAPVAANLAGATTLLGSASLANVLGGLLVLTTPAGWIVGGIILGRSVGLAVFRLSHSGGINDERRQQLLDDSQNS
ncbi:hypothetical protein [Methylobacter psychrophilus]|uniref:hypothetical protein n=1 Tax=Methylobacter psychrophilus TaxID=96941 RepID=UPI0021D48B87|nr:hypothetical protein [Methylobacter psychrophilus]